MQNRVSVSVELHYLFFITVGVIMLMERLKQHTVKETQRTAMFAQIIIIIIIIIETSLTNKTNGC